MHDPHPFNDTALSEPLKWQMLPIALLMFVQVSGGHASMLFLYGLLDCEVPVCSPHVTSCVHVACCLFFCSVVTWLLCSGARHRRHQEGTDLPSEVLLPWRCSQLCL